jgi:plastocyanin
MRLALGLGILACCAPAMAFAADVAVSVRTPQGKPVADAVVAVYPAAGAPAGPVRFPWPLRVEQRDMQFQPFVLIAPAGAEVGFPNRDAVRHHVYSFSPAKRFELKLYGKDDTRAVRFENAGVVALGCNIHDSMVGFIKVVDTPFAAKTDAAGEAVVHGVPAGAARLNVWHPYGKAGDRGVDVKVTTPRQGAVRQAVALEVRNPAPRSKRY